MESAIENDKIQQTQSTQNVLILGGSSFMGLELLKTLAERGNTNVFFVNRGSKYWYK